MKKYDVLWKRVGRLLIEKGDWLEEKRQLLEDIASLKQENAVLHELVDDLSGVLDKENKKDTAGNGV